jgi:hypothetical protein
LSQEQVPSLHIQHLPNRLRFTLQQKIASAAQVQIGFFTLALASSGLFVYLGTGELRPIALGKLCAHILGCARVLCRGGHVLKMDTAKYKLAHGIQKKS